MKVSQEHHAALLARARSNMSANPHKDTAAKPNQHCEVIEPEAARMPQKKDREGQITIHIPHERKSERHAALRRCIAKAARRCDCTEWMAGLLMAHFLEAITDAVTRGEEVVIPNFGRFGHYLKRPRKPGLKPYAQPTFDAAKGWNNQVRWCVIPKAGSMTRRKNYRQNHASFSRNSQAGDARPFVGFAAWRITWMAEAKKYGYRQGDD